MDVDEFRTLFEPVRKSSAVTSVPVTLPAARILSTVKPTLSMTGWIYRLGADEKTSDISSNSSIGSLFVTVEVWRCCDDARPVVPVARWPSNECDGSMVIATARMAIATKPEIIKRFMGTLRLEKPTPCVP